MSGPVWPRPGLVAAQTAGCPLAARSRDDAGRRDAVAELRRHTVEHWARCPVRRRCARTCGRCGRCCPAGWVARLTATGYPERFIDRVAAVIAELPAQGQRRDGRVLADAVTGLLRALDEGALPGLVLAVLVAAGLRTRAAWAVVGVDWGDSSVGCWPRVCTRTGWSMPPGVVVAVVPRELGRCDWPVPPHPAARVYATENPSVVTVAAEITATGPGSAEVRLLCTVGTPSAGGIEAITRLAEAGWRLLVRAGFDEVGG